MSTGFNTHSENGEYRLQFETDKRDYYEFVQFMARLCVDGTERITLDRLQELAEADAERRLVICASSESAMRTAREALDEAFCSLSESTADAEIESKMAQKGATHADN